MTDAHRPPLPANQAQRTDAHAREGAPDPSKDDGLALGPLLYARGYDARTARHHISVLTAVEEGAAPPTVALDGPTVPRVEVDRIGGLVFWRSDLAMPSGTCGYRVNSKQHSVRLADPDGDTAFAFVSCNGKEHGDFERPAHERDAMWDRLEVLHDATPLSLMIMGGDQIYADAALEAHPDLERWADAPPRNRLSIAATEAAEDAVIAVFLDRWVKSVRVPSAARLMAEVPTLAMWDDHDIFDGYGSHPAPVQDSPLGQMVFRVARRFFRLFQAGGHDPATQETLSQTLPQPGFRVLAPDLRSERQRRRVMGPAGWSVLESGYAGAAPGEAVFVLSTVPALGPRLSLVESVHRLIPGAQKYEDDLRDQWQSRAHRAEWRRFLSRAAEHADAVGPVTFLSGEIHLAGRGEMRTPNRSVLHQLIASGISHPPPPRAFARALGALGALGEAPLKGHPIRIRPLPGQKERYLAERNFLLLERVRGAWHARWDLEVSGRTPRLPLPEGDVSATTDGEKAVAP